MIQPTDLRIGNWVKWPNEKEPNEVQWEHGHWLGTFEKNYPFPEPIPLSEEWLRRMDGVEKIESSITVPTWTLDIGRSRRLSISLMAGNTCVWLQAYDPKDSREVTDLVCLFNSDYDGELYVHWFQNLVSAIYRPWN